VIKNILIVSSILVANSAMATSFGEQVTIAYTEPVVMISGTGNNWTMIAQDSTYQMAKVRKFFDLGANGAQQIDYVVNCSDKSVALAGFQVLKSSDSAPAANAAVPSFDDLSFYKPVLEIDRNAANTACDKRLAMSEFPKTN
jgi:hypothetical protein